MTRARSFGVVDFTAADRSLVAIMVGTTQDSLPKRHSISARKIYVYLAAAALA